MNIRATYRIEGLVMNAIAAGLLHPTYLPARYVIPEPFRSKFAVEGE